VSDHVYIESWLALAGDYVQGRGSPHDRRVLDEHLRSCVDGRCAEFLEGLGRSPGLRGMDPDAAAEDRVFLHLVLGLSGGRSPGARQGASAAVPLPSPAHGAQSMSARASHGAPLPPSGLGITRFFVSLRSSGSLDAVRVGVTTETVAVIGAAPNPKAALPNRVYAVDLPLAGVAPLVAEVQMDWSRATPCRLVGYPGALALRVAGAEEGSLAGGRSAPDAAALAGDARGMWVGDRITIPAEVAPDWDLRVARIDGATGVGAVAGGAVFDAVRGYGQERAVLVMLAPPGRSVGGVGRWLVSFGPRSDESALVQLSGPCPLASPPDAAGRTDEVWPFGLSLERRAGLVRLVQLARGAPVLYSFQGSVFYGEPVPLSQEIELLCAHRELDRYVRVCKLVVAPL